MKRVPTPHPIPEEFDWDDGNIFKNEHKHGVSYQECEQVFADPRIITLYDSLHSQKEDLYIGFGKSTYGRLLFISFTIRKGKIRVISARDQTQPEQAFYLVKLRKKGY